MARMRAVQVSEPGGDFELVERDVSAPGPGEALVRVQACGICHSDSYVKEGGFPGISYPAVPGHEIAGGIAALGEDTRGWGGGERVGGPAGSATPGDTAAHAVTASRCSARTWGSRGSPSTAATPTMCWCGQTRW